jgi:hypothetical protein
VDGIVERASMIGVLQTKGGFALAFFSSGAVIEILLEFVKL